MSSSIRSNGQSAGNSQSSLRDPKQDAQQSQQQTAGAGPAERHALAQDKVAGLPADRLETLRAGHVGHYDPMVRATRGVDGVGSRGAVVAASQEGGTQAALTTYHLGVTQAIDNGKGGVQVVADRQSAYLNVTQLLDNGQSVTATAGPLANMAYVGATVHPDAATAISGYGVLTHGGTPGIGGSYSYNTPNLGVAVAPAVLVDKRKTFRALALRDNASSRNKDAANKDKGEQLQQHLAGEKQQPGAKMFLKQLVDNKENQAPTALAKVEETKQQSLFGQLTFNLGGKGVAGAFRATADAESSKRYAREVPLAEARQMGRGNSALGQRLKALGVGAKTEAMPKLHRPGELADNSALTQTFSHSRTLSAGLSVFGVQAMAGNIQSKVTSAEVKRGTPSADNGSVPLTLTLEQGSVTTKTGAVDLPVLASAQIIDNTYAHQSMIYDFQLAAGQRDVTELTQKVRRESLPLGTKGHFSPQLLLRQDDVQNAIKANETFARLQKDEPALQQAQVQTGSGGRIVRVTALPLLANLAGPLLGLGFTRQSDQDVTFARMDENQTMVANGQQWDLQTEVVGRGSTEHQVQILKVEQVANLAGNSVEAGTPQQLPAFDNKTLLQWQTTYSHADGNKVQAVHERLNRLLPNTLGDALGTARRPKLQQTIALTTQLQAVLTPANLRALSGPGKLLPDVAVPADNASAEEQKAFFDDAVSRLKKEIAAQSSAKKVKQIFRALDASQADISANVTSQIFARVAQKTAKYTVAIQPHANRNARAAAAGVLARLDKIESTQKRLHTAEKLLQLPLFQLTPKAQYQRHQQDLQAAKEQLRELAPTDHNMPTLARRVLQQASSSQRAQIQRITKPVAPLAVKDSRHLAEQQGRHAIAAPTQADGRKRPR